MKTKHLIMSTLLFCGLTVFTACTEIQDNPAPDVVVYGERAVFEKQFSKDLQAMADEFRFESVVKATGSLKEFIDVLDENALSNQIMTIVGQLLNGLQATTLDQLSDQDRTAVIAGLKERFGMTDDDIKVMPGFFVVDADKSLGKMKVEFKDGKCTVTNDADAFTIVSTNSKGETKTIVLTFNDARDGVTFFAANLAKTAPIAIQLPKSIGVTLTTPQGQVLNGTVNLTTANANQSKYVNFKISGWTADAKLTANVNNRQEGINLYIKHTEKRAFDLKAAFEITGKEMVRLEVNDMHDAYTDEEIDSDSFKELREMGPFFSTSYELLKALKGKSVDQVIITLNDNMVIEGQVDDIAKSLLALGNVRKLTGTQPGMEAIDQYTQELNKYIRFTVSQKNTGITAQGTLLTAQKDFMEGEYQPAVALQFDGETEAQVMYERMSQTDTENYKKMFDNFSPLVKEVSDMLGVAKSKGEAIVAAVKSYFS